MNTQNDNHAPISIDEPNDRLVEVALMELVGGAAPPDLSSRILASNESRLPKPQTVAAANYSRRFRWISVAIAASLLAAMTAFLLSNSHWLPSQKSAAVNHRQAQQAKIAQMVDEFNQLRDAQRFEEMEPVARRLIELAPNDPVAQQVWLNAKYIRREMMNRQLADDKETSTWQQQLNAVEPSATNPIAEDGKEMPRDQHYWNDFVKDRKKSAEQKTVAKTAAKMAPASQALEFENGGGQAEIAQPPEVPGFAGPGALAAPVTSPPAVVAQAPNRNAAVPAIASADRLGQPARAYAGRAETFGMQTKLQDRALALAPRQQLAPATDGTLDLYAHGDRPQEVTLRPQMPSLQRWPEQGESPLFRDGQSGDQYTPIVENPFIKAEGGDAVSTFGIDVDTASYSNVRQFLLDMHQLPPANAVRIEELVNYFHYDYAGPKPDDKTPFAAHVEVAACPWNAEHRLARIAVKGREMDRDKRPQSNLVFLVDVSGSMNEPAKLPLVKYGLEQLTKELGENDHIAIVVYAGNTGVALPSTSGAKQDVILAALRKLEAGGSTAGGAGIQLAYQIAEENFIKGGTNRVILCTDGDFNVGTTNTDELQKLVATKAKDTGVFISTLGFGRGNLNDAMMVAISDHGNGNYHYIDNRTEARRVLVEQMTGTLVTIAKDVKIQVEFNPAKVAAYRLIGYEKRMLKTEDFNNDKKDAGEIGAGHTVTALYEIVPAHEKVEVAPVDDLKYQKPSQGAPAQRVRDLLDSKSQSHELLTLKMRYKQPDGDTSQKLEWPVTDDEKSFDGATEDFRFAAAVAGFGMLLRDSQFKGDLTFKDVITIAENALGHDEHGFRSEFLEMVREAQRLKGQ